jgi:hypothetical protein
MKRSTQVSLVLMGALGVGGVAFALGGNCQPPQASANPGNVQQAMQQPTAQSTCRSSGGSHASGYGRGFSLFSSSGASGPSPSPAGLSVNRGGFGAIGRALSSIGG